MKLKKVLVSLISFILLVGLFAGCVSQNSGTNSNQAGENKESKNGKLKIAVVPKLVGIPYFNAAEKGAVQAGKDLGLMLFILAQQKRMLLNKSKSSKI
ncbi:hypothetical protein [Geobacillus sp. JS12]|uniref:hypothetical protein n=1 Tax=Geobacillus sp. JS12 TaxID=1813182 RepID=UPI00078BBEF8|nr:hypothetical protein [Geobacillus sp. JS12]AMQ20571.1 hypothetical protein A0V43_06090 [Geobacillus sp. JS12]